MVLGYSRLIWARFVLHQDLQSVLRCHIAAFGAKTKGKVERPFRYIREDFFLVRQRPPASTGT